MSNASDRIGSSGIAMVGGAIAIAIMDLLVKKRILTVDDARAALRTAQSSLTSAPAVTGTSDGARIIGEIAEQFTRRQRRLPRFR